MLFNIFATLLAGATISNILLSGVGLEVLTSKEIRIKPVLIRSLVLSLLSLVVFLLYFVLNTFVLTPLNFGYMSLLVLGLLVVGINELYLLVSRLLKFEINNDRYIGLTSILLVVGFLGLSNLAFLDQIITIVSSLVGFIAFSVLFTTIQSRIRVAPIMKSFKGLPILLIILGCIAIVVTGLGGLF